MRHENRRIPPLTEVQLAEARELRAQDVSWENVGRRLDVPGSKVRRALDPAFRAYERQRNLDYERRAQQRREDAHKLRGSPRCGAVYADNETRNPAYDPLRDGPPRWATPGAELMGEPPIGRSALDKRHA